jgi:hypothetical protein
MVMPLRTVMQIVNILSGMHINRSSLTGWKKGSCHISDVSRRGTDSWVSKVD